MWGDKSELYLGRIVSLGFSVGRDRNDWCPSHDQERRFFPTITNPLGNCWGSWRRTMDISPIWRKMVLITSFRCVRVFQYYESYSSMIVTYHPVHRSCLERKSVVRGFGATCFNETKLSNWICNRGPPPTQSMLLLSLSQMTSLSRTPWNSIFPVFCLESRSKIASSILVFPSKLQRQQNTTDRNVVICHGAEKHCWHRIAINSTKISNYFDTNN